MAINHGQSSLLVALFAWALAGGLAVAQPTRPGPGGGLIATFPVKAELGADDSIRVLTEERVFADRGAMVAARPARVAVEQRDARGGVHSPPDFNNATAAEVERPVPLRVVPTTKGDYHASVAVMRVEAGKNGTRDWLTWTPVQYVPDDDPSPSPSPCRNGWWPNRGRRCSCGFAPEPAGS